MSKVPEDKPEVWGRLGTQGVTEHRKDEIHKKARRSDLIAVYFLIPCGLILILAGAVWMGLAEAPTRLPIASIILGIIAWVGAGKIAFGRR